MKINDLARTVLPSSVVNKLRPLKQRVLRATFKQRTAVHSYLGTQRIVHLADPIGAGWYDRDYVHVPEVEVLKARGVGPGRLIFDLGAHQAVIAMMLADLVGPSGKVVAVEGSGHNVEIARRNISSNSITNITLVNAVVADHVGWVPFIDAGNGFISKVGGPRRSDVEAVTIDSLAARFGVPDVVFMDIEGFEARALEGAQAVLEADTIWLVEVHGDEVVSGYGGCNHSIVSKFLDHGYTLDCSDDETGNFHSFDDAEDTPAGRFYLVAARTPRHRY